MGTRSNNGCLEHGGRPKTSAWGLCNGGNGGFDGFTGGMSGETWLSSSSQSVHGHPGHTHFDWKTIVITQAARRPFPTPHKPFTSLKIRPVRPSKLYLSTVR